MVARRVLPAEENPQRTRPRKASIHRTVTIDPFAYLRDALPGLFALGDEPTAEHLLDWLPDRWRLNRTRDHPTTTALAG